MAKSSPSTLQTRVHARRKHDRGGLASEKAVTLSAGHSKVRAISVLVGIDGRSTFGFSYNKITRCRRVWPRFIRKSSTLR